MLIRSECDRNFLRTRDRGTHVLNPEFRESPMGHSPELDCQDEEKEIRKTSASLE